VLQVRHRWFWQRADGSVGVIELVDEDARGLGEVTLKGLEFDNEDDQVQEEELRPGRRQSRNRVKVEQQGLVVNAEKNRSGVDFGGLEGGTLREAKENAQAKRDARRGGALSEAFGIKVPAANPRSAQPLASMSGKNTSELSYLQRLKAKFSEVFSSEDSGV
jgi:hypothetical protein